MSLTRRTHLLGPGTALLLADTSLHAPVRLREFAAFSGIAPEDLIISPLCSVPLPLYNFAAKSPGARRWPGTRAEAMWHPLMWLPNRLAGRYTYPDPETSEQVRESDDLWIIRVALELTLSGLYDPETGTWVDILDSVGLDISNDVDLARVEEWLDGEPDEILDEIDLGAYLTIEPHDWALVDALLMEPTLRRAAWALTADEILGEAEKVEDPDSGVEADAVESILAALAASGMALLSEVPLRTEDAEPTAADDEEHAAFFLRAHAAMTADDVSEATAAAVLDAIVVRCAAIRDAFWSDLEALHAAADDAASVDGPQGVGAP